jgi:hypothetical protein
MKQKPLFFAKPGIEAKDFAIDGIREYIHLQESIT